MLQAASEHALGPLLPWETVRPAYIQILQRLLSYLERGKRRGDVEITLEPPKAGELLQERALKRARRVGSATVYYPAGPQPR